MSSDGSKHCRSGFFANESPEEWYLVLYVAPACPGTSFIVESVERFCEKRLAGRYKLEVIDITEDYQRAAADRVPAIPALVRRSPGPIRRLIGNFSTDSYLAIGLGTA